MYVYLLCIQFHQLTESQHCVLCMNDESHFRFFFFIIKKNQMVLASFVHIIHQMTEGQQWWDVIVQGKGISWSLSPYGIICDMSTYSNFFTIFSTKSARKLNLIYYCIRKNIKTVACCCINKRQHYHNLNLLSLQWNRCS